MEGSDGFLAQSLESQKDRGHLTTERLAWKEHEYAKIESLSYTKVEIWGEGWLYKSRILGTARLEIEA